VKIDFRPLKGTKDASEYIISVSFLYTPSGKVKKLPKMKTFSSIFVVFFLSISLFAAQRCERLEFYDMDHLQTSFEQDLLSNIWRTNLLGNMSNLYFQDDGLVIAVPVGSEAVESYLWSLVTTVEGQTTLSLYNPTVEKTFVISPTCNGISATAHGRSTQILISSVERLSAMQLDFMRLQLTGTWYYDPLSSEKTIAAGFSITLNANGTCMLQMGPDSYHSICEGVWRLSQDGRYLILYSEMYVGQEKKYIAESINLYSVDFEDMVIDAAMLPRALQQYQSKQMLYLIKARA
jgi:hypothetical protein